MHSAWRIFQAMATQWKATPVGLAGSVRTGLDYTSLEPVARSLGLDYPLDPQTFADIRLMEAEALSVWSKRRG